MKDDIKFFGDFINHCYGLLKIEIFDWGFNFADLIVTGLIITAVMNFILKFIGSTSAINLKGMSKPINNINNSGKGKNGK